jgi:hypothetical protein
VPPFGRDQATFQQVRWLAVIDSSIALFGTIASVQRELDRHLAHSPADPSLMGKLARLRRDDETWCVLTANTQSTEIRNALWALDPKLADVIESGDAFQFGVRYSRHVEFEYEVNTASSADAQTLSNSLAQSLGGHREKDRHFCLLLIGLRLAVLCIDEKDIDVSIQNNTLTVHGERKIEKEEKEENFRRVERQYGSFSRSFTLPSSVHPGQVSARCDKGVLNINLAKKSEAKPTQIKVNVGGEKSLEAIAAGKAA